MEQTTMKTTRESLDRLRNHGKCGDSLDNVLNKLLDKIEDKLEDVTERVEDLEADIDGEKEKAEND